MTGTVYLDPGLPVDVIYGKPDIVFPDDYITGQNTLRIPTTTIVSSSYQKNFVQNGPSGLNQNVVIVTGADEYGQMLETQWRGIGFPCSKLEQSNSFDLAIHKYPHLDVARVENMGRNSRVFTLTIPFVNTIARGNNETWSPGQQFGTNSNWQKLRDNWDNDKSSGYLQHPELGNIICKIQKYTVKYEERPRNGVIVVAEFIECIDDALTLQDTNGATIISLTTQGYSLDVSVANLPVGVSPPGLNLLQAFSNISGFINNIISYPGRTAMSLNAKLNAYASVIEGTAQDIYKAPGLIYDQTLAIFNQNKAYQLGVVSNFKQQTTDYSKLINSFGSSPSSTGNVTITASGAVVQTKSTNTTKSIAQNISTITSRRPTVSVKYNIQKLRQVIAAYQNLVSTSHKSSSSTVAINTATGKSTVQNQVISKAIAFTQSMIEYYNSLHHNSTAEVVQGLYGYVATLQQLSTSSSSNVLSFVTQSPMSWIQVANYTNNSLAQIMTLNRINDTMVMVPKNSVMYYISVTGA